MFLSEKLGVRGKSSDQKKEAPPAQPLGDQWVQKSVLLQREEKGYGFRLTGSCPAQVQSVRDNSAAARAGVVPCDKIFKVNGTLVTGMKHEDVVKLIDSNSHVQLVLLHRVSSETTPPIPSHTSPASSDGVKRLAIVVEDDVQKTGAGSKHKKTPSLPESMVDMHQYHPHADVGDDEDDIDSRLVRRNSDSKRRLDTGSADPDGQMRNRARSQSMPYVAMTVKSRLLWALKGALSINDEPLGEANDDQVDEAPSTGGIGRSAPVFVPFQEVQIMSMEDQELASDDHVTEQGPFSSFAELIQKPAHLSVFLQFLFTSSNPDAMLFRLVAETYVRGPTKEMKRWAYEIFSTFVAEGSPLQVALQPFIVCDMDEVLLYKSDKEDVMKSIFDQAKEYVESEINDSLAEYRSKSLMGLDSMYGAHELTKVSGNKPEELMLATKFLWQHFERLSEISKKTDKDMALIWALATVMKDMGLINVVPNPTLLDNTPSFACKEKQFKLVRNSRKTVSLLDHQFQPQQFFAMTTCSCCQKVLWGIGCQGYQCNNCESSIHYNCISQMSDKCQGKGKAKRYSKSVSGMLGRMSAPLQRRATGLQAVSPTQGNAVHYSQSVRDPSHHALTTDDDLEERGLHRKMYDSPAADSLEEDSNMSDDDATITSDLSRNVSDASRSTVSSNASDYSLVSLRSLEDDKDLDTEADMPPLEAVIPKDVLKKLKPKEKKRQEVINELFYTEANHVRNLRVLQKVFYQPLSKHKFSDRLLEHCFPNLDDVHRLHANLNASFKERRKENVVVGNVGDLLLATFGGEAGFRFRSAMAKFCGNQVHAGNLLRQRQRNDQKFAQILQELNSNSLCRRLELKDLLPTIMQRLTKYPLLIENLLKFSQPDGVDFKNLQKALECSRDTLSYVNKEVRECENRQRLEDIHSRLDVSSMPKDFAMIDLRERKLLHHGTLVWKINAGRLIDVYMLLLDTHIVLLERKETRYVLRQQNAAIGGDQFLYSPLVDLPGMIVRLNAGDAKAFFLIKVIPAVKSAEESGSSKKKAHSQIYELIAGSKDEHKTWVKNIEAAISAQPKGIPVVAPTIRTAAATPSQPVVVAPSASGSPGAGDILRPAKDAVTPISSVIVAGGATAIDDEEIADIVRQRESAVLDRSKSSSSSSTGSLDMVAHAETYEVVPQLIHPTEVVVKNHVFVGGGATYGSSGDLTLADKLRRENEVMAHALHTKRKIIAEMFNVPETDYHGMFENVDDEGMDPLACLLEDSRQLTSLCSQAETCTRRIPVRVDDDLDDGAAAADTDDQTMRVCMELDYESMVSLIERFNNHLMQLLDDRLATDVATPSKSVDTSRSPLVSSAKSGLMSVDRQDEVMHVEPRRHELRIKGRQRDSYMTAVEMSPEPEVAVVGFETVRSHKLGVLSEWTPNIETDQYDVVTSPTS